jgi:TatD DNase family protein
VSGKGRRGGDDERGEPVPAPAPLAVPVVDAHCHLDLMGGDVAANVAEAASVGVRQVLTIGIDLETSRWAAATAAGYEHVWAAAAVHPNEAARGAAGDDVLTEISALALLPDVRAVGETGLDHYRTEGTAAHALQESAFRAHIAIAKQSGKALVVHDRDAHEDVLRVLADEGPPEATVFHAFSGDTEMVRSCAHAGFFMSFAGNVTFANAPMLREAAAQVPDELLLVETDAPFLTPVPHRGRPNGPHLVPLTMRLLADVRRADLDTLCATVSANAARAFGIPDFTK